MRIHTETLEKQHIEIKAIMAQILKSLDIPALQKDAEEARGLVSRLVGKLSVHLAMEDNVLYPNLASSSDPRLKEMGNSFQDKMGGLLKALKTYQSSWPTVGSVQTNPHQFIKDTTVLFDALNERIKLEDEVLFAAINSRPAR